MGGNLRHRDVSSGRLATGWNRSKRDLPYYDRDLDKALLSADVVSRHLALNDVTRGVVDAMRRYLPKKGFLLVTPRSALIDQVAVYDAPETGQIGHAALDVFDQEHLPASYPHLALDKVN
jgi:phosphoglycerate dehydrogenase-like enzyme